MMKKRLSSLLPRKTERQSEIVIEMEPDNNHDESSTLLVRKEWVMERCNNTEEREHQYQRHLAQYGVHIVRQ